MIISGCGVHSPKYPVPETDTLDTGKLFSGPVPNFPGARVHLYIPLRFENRMNVIPPSAAQGQSQIPVSHTKEKDGILIST